MPPLNPPPQCEKHMERRADDTLDVVKKRLQVSFLVDLTLTLSTDPSAQSPATRFTLLF